MNETIQNTLQTCGSLCEDISVITTISISILSLLIFLLMGIFMTSSEQGRSKFMKIWGFSLFFIVVIVVIILFFPGIIIDILQFLS